MSKYAKTTHDYEGHINPEEHGNTDEKQHGKIVVDVIKKIWENIGEAYDLTWNWTRKRTNTKMFTKSTVALSASILINFVILTKDS